jgi:hypothetical protein
MPHPHHHHALGMAHRSSYHRCPPSQHLVHTRVDHQVIVQHAISTAEHTEHGGEVGALCLASNHQPRAAGEGGLGGGDQGHDVAQGRAAGGGGVVERVATNREAQDGGAEQGRHGL